MKILLSGGSGFIAAHCLDQLLKHGHNVVTTVRSEEKGQKILENHQGIPLSRLSYIVVEDIAQEGSFDQAVVSDPPFDAVVHTASPFHFNTTDAKKDMLDPAIIGTTGILRAIKSKAPNVRRAVVTSSFAAIINSKEHPETYSEESWNPVTKEEASNDPSTAYRASKTLAERAVWDFVKNEKPNFQVCTICPPLVLGPVVHYLNSLEATNTSNIRIRDMIQGKMRDQPAGSTISLWVDVRDVATAHIRAVELPEAGDKRIFVVAGYVCNKDIADCIRNDFSELRSQLPSAGSEGGVLKDMYKYDNSRSVNILGLKYRSLNESVRDTVESLQAVGA